MDQDKKRELRQLKREIKRKGGKLRRRRLKQGLLENPEDARNAVVDFGRYESKPLNGLDRTQARVPLHPLESAPEGGPEEGV